MPVSVIRLPLTIVLAGIPDDASPSTGMRFEPTAISARQRSPSRVDPVHRSRDASQGAIRAPRWARS